MNLQLRDYQTECLTAISEASNASVFKQLVSLPTGTGKTIIFAHIVKSIAERGGRSLILVHRDELARQAEDKLLTIWPEAEIGIIKAARNELDAPVTIASIQTISRETRLTQLRGKRAFDFLVTDEAHHAVASTYRNVYDEVMGQRHGVTHLGVTATVNRGDNQGLMAVYEKVVYYRSLLEMVRAGWLCDLRCVRIRTEISLDSVHTTAGDFAQGELAGVLNTDNRNELIVEAYQEHAMGRMALCFTADVLHATDLAEAFRQEGVKALSISGKTPIEERRYILKAFHNREFQVLCNCQVLTEGYDEAGIDCIILARPTKSGALYTQMVGRGTRTFPGKDDCLILDFADVSSRHAIIQLPHLGGLKSDQEFDGNETLTEMVDRYQEKEEKGVTGKGVESSAINILDRSKLRWLHMPDDRYLLSLGDEGEILVVPTDDFGKYIVVHIEKGGQKGEADHLSDGPVSFSWATGIAEAAAHRITKGNLGITIKGAKWRTAPVTEKQIRILDQYDVAYNDQTTKGEAADIISVIFTSEKAAAY